MENLYKTLKCVIFSILLFFAAYFGFLFIAVPCIPIIWISPKLFRKLMDEMIGYWEYFAVALFELFLGIKIIITGDIIERNERNLILLNHRTRLDWMFFWSVLIRYTTTKTEKIILKEPLKYIPGAGWSMQAASYIFLKRKWEDDKNYINCLLNYLIKLKHKTQILLFPEGTDFCEKSVKQSNSFANKNNLEEYKYVLHPRTTGFAYILQSMKQNNHLDAVYDVTVAYPDGICESELSFICGRQPKTVVFNIDRYNISQCPTSEEESIRWCQNIYRKKENVLKECYSNDPIKKNIFKNIYEGDSKRFELCFAIFYWIMFLGFSLYLLSSHYIILCWLVLSSILSHIVTLNGGLEIFTAKVFLKQ